MSTISAALSRRLLAQHEARRQECRPVFDALGQGTEVVGDDPPNANVVKIAGNFLLAAAIEAMGEAFALVRKQGIDPARFIEVVNGRLLRSPVLENYANIILAERWEPPGFKLRHGLKDVRLALGTGDELDVPLPVASLMRDHYLEAMARGWGDIDWSALARVSAVHAGL